jgi:DNA-directed RNA polymerase subunit K/omega
MSTEFYKHITKYERVMIIAQRAQDIANGSPITIKNAGTTDPIQIAKLELMYNKIPYKIVRTSPSGEQTIIKVSEFTH